MNWLKLTINQMTRIFGGLLFKEDMTEAELVDTLEGIQPISEQVATLTEHVKEKDALILELQEAQKATEAKVTEQEAAIVEITETEQATKTELVSLIQSLQKEVAALRKESADEFLKIKAGPVAAGKTDPVLEIGKGKDTKENKINADFIDTMLNGMTVGLK